MTPLDFDLSDPRLDSDAPPAFTCGECHTTHLAADLFAFAASRLRTRCADLEVRLRLTLEYVEELEGLAHSLERQIAACETLAPAAFTADDGAETVTATSLPKVRRSRHDTEPAIVFVDDAPTDEDPFGLLDPPTLVRVLEIAPDPFAVAAAGESSGGESESFAAVVGRCGDVIFDGSGHTCTLAPGHTGLHAVTESDGRPSLVWGRSRV